VGDRILLIEDDQRLSEMVKNYLGEAGFSVSVAGNGAIGIALEARETFDVLVLDLMLPDMDGLEVCRRVSARSETPILMLTARGDAWTAWSASKWAPTTICRNRSSPANCWLG
jgi:DNA-binding response OmpR family regulator